MAGVLGNILEEGACGIFEYSTYTNPELKPAYLVYMEENYDYQNTYSGKYIYNGFSLSKVYNMILSWPHRQPTAMQALRPGLPPVDRLHPLKRLLENYMAAARRR